MNSPRFQLFGPSTADKLLAEGYSLEIKLIKFPDDDGVMRTSMSVELKSEFDADDEGEGIAADLIRQFRQSGESEVGHA